MKALLDTHILLWWFSEAPRLSFHRDPADRIIVASARVLGATLLTQDSRILDADLVPTIG